MDNRKFRKNENIICIKDYDADLTCYNLGTTNSKTITKTPEYNIRKNEIYVFLGYSRIDGNIFIKDIGQDNIRVFTYKSEHFDKLKNLRKQKLEQLNRNGI